jgi:L-iditol 2-dehydrogenase
VDRKLKCAVFYGVNDIRIEERDMPVADNENFIIKVENCGVCGTDVRIYRHGHPKINKPVVLGHQIAGKIHELKSKVHDFSVGDRVILFPTIPCGKCYYCKLGQTQHCIGESYHLGTNLDGGYSEYVKVPLSIFERGCVLKLPNSVSSEEGGLIEPLSVVIHALNRMELTKENIERENIKNVTVIGAGPVGIMFLLLLKRLVPKIIMVDISENRLKTSCRFGADKIINPRNEDLRGEILKETGGLGSDVVIVANSSNEAQEQSLNLVRKIGKLAFFGALPPDRPYIRFESNLIQQHDVTLYGIYGATFKDFKEALELVADKKIDIKPLITHRFKLQDVEKAFVAVEKGEALHATVSP